MPRSCSLTHATLMSIAIERIAERLPSVTSYDCNYNCNPNKLERFRLVHIFLAAKCSSLFRLQS